MEEFLTNLSNPGWWLGVVVIGILLNIISSYLKRLLDKILSRYSESIRRSSDARKSAYNARLEVLRASPDERKLLKLEIIDTKVQALIFLLLCIAGFSLFIINVHILRSPKANPVTVQIIQRVLLGGSGLVLFISLIYLSNSFSLSALYDASIKDDNTET